MKNKGFSLVELIVVIAIMAILVGVAVPVYTSYISSAQKSKDIQMVDEVTHALMVAYAAGDLTEDGYIILSSNKDADPDYNNNAEIAAVMESIFGADWADKMTLSSDEWLGMTSDQVFAAAYQASSYNGNEDALITQLGSVTNMLKDALASNASLVGQSFNNYLTTNKIDATNNQAVSNAAILYAANNISSLSETQTAAVNDAFNAFYNPAADEYGNMGDLVLNLKNELGIFGAVAAIYAHGEAFGQFVANNGNGDLLEEFHDIDVSTVTDTEQALEQVAQKMGEMVETAKTDETINPYAMQYIGTQQYAKDLNAYLEAMKKIDANEDKFSDNLGSEGCYTDGAAAALLQAAVNAGSLDISCEDGEVAIWIYGGATGNTIFGIQD